MRRLADCPRLQLAEDGPIERLERVGLSRGNQPQVDP
jgi:hypothetical protein